MKSKETRLNAADGVLSLNRVVSRIIAQNKNAKLCIEYAKGFRRVACGALLLCAAFALSSCTTTPKSEYEMDTTPTHNGEHWQGGE